MHRLPWLRAAAFSLACASLAHAQATLPRPDPPFTGTIQRTLAGSHADAAAPVRPPAGAPNVVIVLIDDAGFGNPATFGGPVATPTLDRLASEGLRYNRFHVTALCSPTRAALLSGRNHHSVGFGMITEIHGGFPGYDAQWPRSAASLATILRDNGYSTAAVGKWHLTPDDEQGPAGPFDRWPNQLGFQYFWGFLGGEDSHYDSMLVENNSILGVPTEKGFYLTTAMADQAIAWLRGQKSQAPDQPFFLYFATGASHSPHHVPKEWADEYAGKFDAGWDALRRETFERQKRLGVIPQDAVLTPRPADFPDWDPLPADQKQLYARQMEVYAGFQEATDHEVGRVLGAIEAMGLRDDTLVLYIFGDNGASMEGTETGSFNELTILNGLPITPDQQLEAIHRYGGLDVWGGPRTHPHYAAAWALAGNTPFPWGKQVASHLGGTRNGMVVSWPKRIRDAGGLRSPKPLAPAQFTFYPGVENVAQGMIPPIFNRSFSITADIEVAEGWCLFDLCTGGDGVIAANGSFLGGFSLYVEGRRLRYTYSFLGVKVDALVADERLRSGKVQVRYEFTADEPGKLATGGTHRLFVADEPVAEGKLEHTVPLRFSGHAGLDVGRDNGLPVSPGKVYYVRAPFPFEGKIEKVVFDLK
jgi:arylsulfatase A-like enzyme